ncbi:MAG: hydrolase [Nocardioides sp.]|uniref:alpha/beta hydrolase family protein n=1 Tax=Nocardioides sp. TaxID=35761 RepID=UPI0039E582DB
MSAPTETTVPTAYGEGRLVRHTTADPRATLLLSHGAGGGIASPDLVALAVGLPPRGIEVALFEQPWRTAGKRIASPPRTLDAGIAAAAERLREDLDDETPLVVGGRSAGARSACRTAASLGAAGCLALAFPLHPPGRPERSRLDELAGAGVPTLVVQGGRDPFGTPAEFPPPDPHMCVISYDVSPTPSGCHRTNARSWPGELVEIPFGDHAFKVAARHRAEAGDPLATIVDAVAEWTLRLVG